MTGIYPEIGPELLFSAALEEITELQGKVYPAGGLQNAAAPFAFFEQAEERQEEALDGLTGLMFSRFRVHAVAENYYTLAILGRKVLARLRRMQGQALVRGDSGEVGLASADMAVAGVDGGRLLLEQVTVRQASPDLWDRDVGLYRRVYEVEIHWQAEN